MMSIDEIEDIMDDTKDAIEHQRVMKQRRIHKRIMSKNLILN